MGGVYKEQKEKNPLPTISNPSLLTINSKPTSRKEKKLIVLHNFTSLETCACIMRELRDASTDIIIVSNELFCKEEIAKEFDKNFNRGCNIIEVTNLQHISIMQRIVYGLLEKNSFVARDADHIVFTLLSEYSRGAATIVHMLTSLMQKSDDDSRTGFELAKQQLKLHIAHRTLGTQNRLVVESAMPTNQPTGDRQTNLVAGSDDDKQTSSSDTTQPPATTSPVFIHPFYLYVNDLLSTAHNISLPAHHLLNSLVITRPIPLPLFYVEELDNVVISAVYSKEKERIQAESPMKQLIKEGVIRKSCYPILYHKDFNTGYIDLSIQPMFVPKLICDAVKDEMDDTDIVLSVLSVQCALENLLTNKNKPNPIHLQYLLILCNQLHDVCSEELHEFGDQLLITNQKLKLRVALMASELKA